MERVCRREQSWRSVGSKTILNVKCKAIFSILLEEKKNFFFWDFRLEEVPAPKEKSFRFCSGENYPILYLPPLPSCSPTSELFLASRATFAIWEVWYLSNASLRAQLGLRVLEA